MGGVGDPTSWTYIHFPPVGGITLSMARLSFSSRLSMTGPRIRGSINPIIPMRRLLSSE